MRARRHASAVAIALTSTAALLAACGASGEDAASGTSSSGPTTAHDARSSPGATETEQDGSEQAQVDQGETEVSGATRAGPDEGPETLGIVQRHGELGPVVSVTGSPQPDGTAGSGCSPDDTATLPDGTWMVEVVEFGQRRVDVDLVCYSTVESLQEAGRDAAIEDFEIRNDDARIRTLDLAADARFVLQTVPPVMVVGAEPSPRTFDDPREAGRFATTSGDDAVLGWLLVEDGVVAEFYSPPLVSA